jgi:hypothetical protein
LFIVSTLISCSSSSEEPNQPDAAIGCSLEPQISRARFEEESVAYLRAAFATTTGFEGGTITYGETAVPLTDAPCPIADWTGLTYTVAADPALFPVEMRATHDRVSAVWWLNGRKAVAIVPKDYPANEYDQWRYARLPDNFNVVVRQDADIDDVRDVIDQVRAMQPGLVVEYLEAIGVVTVTASIGTFIEDAVGSVTVPEMDEAAQPFRAAELFEALDWTGPVLRIPNDGWPGKALTGEMLAPECEREHTRDRRDQNQFTTEPALAAPLGDGPITKTPVCE